ncbi:MAG: SpoIIE family protein phosphatase [Oscillospiraceae bacterium]|nr:SpoIIE family protein phosphatase [Oscillospiraceae bacterium]
MNTVPKKGLSLKIAVMCAILVIVLLIGTLMTISAYLAKQNLVITGYGEQTIRLAQTVASAIDPVRFTQTIEAGEVDDYWHEVKEFLDRTINETGVMFIYTLLPGYSDEITYFATGDIIGAEWPVDFLHTDTVEWYPPELFHTMDTGIPSSTGIYDADEFGILIGGFTPLFDSSGRIAGVVCVEISVSEVIATIDRSMLVMTLYAVIVVIVFFILAMFVANRGLIKPVNEMTETMSKVCDGDFNFKFPKSSIREIKALSDSFSKMIHTLHAMTDEIQNRSREIAKGHLTKSDEGYTAKGDFQKILDGVDATAENAAKYLDEVACGVILFDTDYRITFVNAYNRNLGYTNLTGKKLCDAISNNAGAVMAEKLAEAARTGEPAFYGVEILLPDGRKIHTNHTMVALKDKAGEAVSFMNVANDVTEIVNTQAELAKRLQTINEGIRYASKIQMSIIPDDAELKKAFLDYSIIWMPRDVVGGDIYWAKNFDDGTVLCVCDCTGHGTPGALLTMLVVSAFESTITEQSHTDTAEVLYTLDRRLATVLNVKNNNNYTDINDGCDLAVLFISNDGSVSVSSGNTNIFVCDGKSVIRNKGQKMFIGEGKITGKDNIKTVTYPANPANKFYIASDGLYDQIGGEELIPYGYDEFEKIILANHNEKHSTISEKVWYSFENYRGDNARRDDFELITFTPKIIKEEDNNV